MVYVTCPSSLNNFAAPSTTRRPGGVKQLEQDQGTLRLSPDAALGKHNASVTLVRGKENFRERPLSVRSCSALNILTQTVSSNPMRCPNETFPLPRSPPGIIWTTLGQEKCNDSLIAIQISSSLLQLLPLAQQHPRAPKGCSAPSPSPRAQRTDNVPQKFLICLYFEHPSQDRTNT